MPGILAPPSCPTCGQTVTTPVADTKPPLQITPKIAQGFRDRLKNADSDDDLRGIVSDAAKYGVDWSHMLHGLHD